MPERLDQVGEWQPLVEPRAPGRAHHDLRAITTSSSLTLTVYDLERSRRRSRDVAAIEVVLAVVAGAPDRCRLPVLNRAVEMCAGRRERPQVTRRRSDDDAGAKEIFSTGGKKFALERAG